MSALHVAERPAAAAPQGLLVLHHGRGTAELDLLPLADALDPQRRLHVAAPRGPLEFPGLPGRHWYRVPRVGHPDPPSFAASQEQLATLHQSLLERLELGPERLILGGFSMGAVMSYAVGLDPRWAAPAGILAFSGFIPTVPGWSPDLTRTDVGVLIAHGTADPVISVEFARRARALLSGVGFAVDYREFPGPHSIAPADLRRAQGWIVTRLGL